MVTLAALVKIFQINPINIHHLEMNAATALEEARLEWAEAHDDLVELLIRRRRDPRPMNPHLAGLLTQKIRRLTAAAQLMQQRMIHILASPLVRFIPARQEDLPRSQWRPLRPIDHFWLQLGWFRPPQSEDTWSTDASSRPDSPVEPGFEI